MQADWVDRFVEALHGLEDRDEVEPLVSQFAPEGTLWNIVHAQPLSGPEQIRDFWTSYRDQFDRIHSTFERTVVGDEEAALEWRAEGRLRGGREIAYRGVTVLARRGDGIQEFASYYDPRPFQMEASTVAAEAERSFEDDSEPTGESKAAPSVMSYR